MKTYQFLALTLFLFTHSIHKLGAVDIFNICDKKNLVTIIYDKNGRSLDSISSWLLAFDIKQVTGKLPNVIAGEDGNGVKGNVIVVGNLESALVQDFMDGKTTLPVNFNEEWERYALILKKLKGGNKALIVAGSDNRGTSYGVFDLSERIGVSPWYWWADIIPERKESLSITIDNFISKTPSVKYRGVFLNDEDWGLQPWAAKTFEPETGDIGPKTYAKIFELLLRLKANMIWPAMHHCTKAFFSYPGNKEMAKKYGIVIGTSHAEPMLRNNVDEWNKKLMGEFNYQVNESVINKYWESRAIESKNLEAIYTIGLRGIHDSGMEGFGSMSEKVGAMEGIIKKQREILSKSIGKKADQIPQVFTPYKEVLEIYDNGLKLPDDVTIVWTDDNYGYIRRLSNSEEISRKGGGGVYYHLSYWGRPHDYLWLSTTHPLLIWEEMTKAYNNGAQTLWIANVGDIKPAEFNTNLFLDMAYDISKYEKSAYVWDFHTKWMSRLLPSQSESVTEVFKQYYSLSFERRPEFMGWSSVEPKTRTKQSEYNHFYYSDEAQKRLDICTEMIEKVDRMKPFVHSTLKNAYFQLVEYPVKCNAWMNAKFLALEKAYLYAEQERLSCNNYSEQSRSAYDSINFFTNKYNTLSAGKWNGMMSMAPRDLPVFSLPPLPKWSGAGSEVLSISVEGLESFAYRNNTTWNLPTFYQGSTQKYFVDIFLKADTKIDWEAISSDEWIKLSSSKGQLDGKSGDKEQRIWISVDWDKIPNHSINRGSLILKTPDNSFRIGVRLNKSEVGQNNDIRHTEMNRYVSIFAENYSNISPKGWGVLDGLGYSGELLFSLDNNRKRLNHSDSVWVDYDFYTKSKGRCKLNIYVLPNHPLNSDCNLELGIIVDNQAMQRINFQTYGRSNEWKTNVLSNSAKRQLEIDLKDSGKHTLRIVAFDPVIMIDRLEIDFGGLRNSYSEIDETILYEKETK